MQLTHTFGIFSPSGDGACHEPRLADGLRHFA